MHTLFYLITFLLLIYEISIVADTKKYSDFVDKLDENNKLPKEEQQIFYLQNLGQTIMHTITNFTYLIMCILGIIATSYKIEWGIIFLLAIIWMFIKKEMKSESKLQFRRMDAIICSIALASIIVQEFFIK